MLEILREILKETLMCALVLLLLAATLGVFEDKYHPIKFKGEKQ